MYLNWNYKTAFLRCAVLLAAGTTFQLFTGDIPEGFLHYPWNAVLSLNYLYLLVLAYCCSDRYRWLRTLWDGKACISSLASVLVLVTVSGFHRITESWPFNLMLVYFMTALGIRSISEIAGLRHIRRTAGGLRRKVFIFSRTIMHTGIFLLILAGIAGSGDKVRYKVAAVRGIPSASAEDSEGRKVTLPFHITLKEFSIDEYPPRLYLFDSRDGRISEKYVSVEDEGSSADLEEWRIKVEQYLGYSGCLPGDSVYRAMEHVGAAPAVYVSAVRRATGERYSGWVSCGSHIFPSSELDLHDGESVVMPEPYAKGYCSKVVISDMQGKSREYDIEVNHPARYGAWRVYQAGYDTSRGRWSTISVLECVKDPWYPLAAAALYGLLTAAAAMFLSAGGYSQGLKKRRR